MASGPPNLAPALLRLHRTHFPLLCAAAVVTFVQLPQRPMPFLLPDLCSAVPMTLPPSLPGQPTHPSDLNSQR